MTVSSIPAYVFYFFFPCFTTFLGHSVKYEIVAMKVSIFFLSLILVECFPFHNKAWCLLFHSLMGQGRFLDV